MKKFIINCLVLFISKSLFAQHCNIGDNENPGVVLKIRTTELNGISGEFTLQIVVKATRKIYFPSRLHLDNSSSLFFEEIPDNSSYSAPDTLQIGDSLVHDISFSYNSNELPLKPEI